MTFPITAWLDRFDRANEMPLNQTNWLDLYGVTVRTNQANSSITGNGWSFYNTSFGPACDAYVTIPTIDTASTWQCKLYARYNLTTLNGYMVSATYVDGAGNDTIVLSKQTGAVDTVLATYTTTLTNGNGIGLRCSGNNLSVYELAGGGWGLLGTTVDATYPGAGYCGLYIGVNGFGTDGIPLINFGAGNTTGAVFPEPAVLDTFVRANEGPPPSASWVDEYALGVVGNACAARQTVNNYYAGALWRSIIGPSQEVYVNVSTRPIDTGTVDLYARWQNSNNNLKLTVTRADVGGDTVDLTEIVAGVQNTIAGPYSIDFQAGDGFGLRCDGATVSVWYNSGSGWGMLGTGTTTLPVTSGRIGLRGSDTTVRLDEFGGGVYSFAVTMKGGVIMPTGNTYGKQSSHVYIKKFGTFLPYDWGGCCMMIGDITEALGGQSVTYKQNARGGIVRDVVRDDVPGDVTTELSMKQLQGDKMKTTLIRCRWNIDKRTHCGSGTDRDNPMAWEEIRRIVYAKISDRTDTGSTWEADEDAIITLPVVALKAYDIYKVNGSPVSTGGGGT